MKRILWGLLLCASTAFGTTLNPIQLLNPTGSTTGQAIVSTGSSTAPTWGTVTAGSLVAQAANTVVANVTASSASPTAVALPSCSTVNSALKYTSATGFSCGTTYALTSGNLSQFAATTSAQLAGVISDETGTGVLVFSASPAMTGTPTAPTATGTTNTTQVATTAMVNSAVTGGSLAGSFTTIGASGLISPTSTIGIKGTVTNDSPAAGSVGEHVTATGTGVSITTATPLNVTSISLTAGDWEVSASLTFIPAGTTTVSLLDGGINTTTATLPGDPLNWLIQSTGGLTTGAKQGSAIPTQRISVASTTTVFLVGEALFGVSTMTATGTIRARRVR